MHPLALLGIIGGGFFAGSMLNKQTIDDKDLDPKILGMNAQTAIGLGGVLLMLLGGPIMGAIGVGTVVGAAVSADAMARVKTGMQKFVEEQVVAFLSQQKEGQIDVKKAQKTILDLLEHPAR